MSLKHDFECVDQCCSHRVVLKQDVDVEVDVEEICTTQVLSSSSLSGNVAPVLLQETSAVVRSQMRSQTHPMILRGLRPQ